MCVFNEFDGKGSNFLWFMQINIGICLIFCLYFRDCVENAVVCNAYSDWHFAFAGDDANIHWVGDQRQMFATFFASKQSQIAKETTCSCNTAGLDTMWIVLNFLDFIGWNVDFPCKKVDVDLVCCYC